jgi:hypothetical protein
MDTAVALVQTYLRVNGYFTVTEYPVMELPHAGAARSVTDLDILAYRFAGAGHETIHPAARLRPGTMALSVDPKLHAPLDRPDMIVGEVKEGRARINPALGRPAVLEVALTRFGCCEPQEAAELVSRLVRQGHVMTPPGHMIRIVAFGGPLLDAATTGRPWLVVSMGHVVQFLQEYVRVNWPVLRHAQLHDPGFAILALLEKWGVARPRAGDSPHVATLAPAPRDH